MMLWYNPGEPADSYYEVRPECTDVPKSTFKIRAGKTLSVRRWKAAFSPEGHLDIGKTLGRIQRGVSAIFDGSKSSSHAQNAGIHPEIRGEVWEFLLGCYDPYSTYEEREEIRESRRVQYARWKEVCNQMFPLIGSGKYVTAPVIAENGDPTNDPLVLQELGIGDGSDPDATSAAMAGMEKETDKKIINWKLLLHQIGLDVRRTDRTLVFYEKPENLGKLWDILSIYAWADDDVGYCQGMSDICSPMIILIENEADAFWCFERLMRKLRGNFRCTGGMVGVESQLTNLASVTQVIDPKLHAHLETLGGGDYLFAIRMLMVLFRREFSFVDSLYLWEMMWALEYDPDLYWAYEEPPDTSSEKDEGEKAEGCEKAEGLTRRMKSIRQYGKFERDNMKNGAKEGPLPMSVFLVASVLKEKGPQLLTQARGIDDVVKILNDTTGSLDAKKACIGAMKLHKKYLKKANCKPS